MSFFSKQSVSLIFESYGTYHYIALAFAFTAILLTFLFRKSIRSWKHEKTLRIITVSAAILFEAAYKVWVIFLGQNVISEIFSLDLCAISLYMAWVLAFNKNKNLFKILYFFALGAFVALIFPEFGQYGPDHLRYYHYFMVHTYIVWLVSYFICVYGYKIVFWDYIKSLLIIVPLGFSVLGINILFNVNFMYLREKPDVSTPLDMMGEWPAYVFQLVIVVAVLFAFIYIPWIFSDIKAGIKESSVEAIDENKVSTENMEAPV